MSSSTQAEAARTVDRSPHAGGHSSFFFRYLGRELGRRARQATVIALGLALGIGLVITVSAAAAGVKNAQASVLHSLYGVGTDITVTQSPSAGSGLKQVHNSIGIQGGGGAGSTPTVCINGKCSTGAQTIANLTSTPGDGPIKYADIDKIAKLRDVKAAAGGLALSDTHISISSTSAGQPQQFTVQGVDLAHENLGPLSNASLSSGHSFTTADANSDVALVDADYAKSSNLKVGDDITVAKTKFTIIGIVTQDEASTPPDVYIPLDRAQALGTQGLDGTSLKGDVNTIYVSAANDSDIAAVSKEIKAVLPTATVTTPSSLASEINGSLGSAAKLAGDLGTWLSILVLIVAFAVAGLLTMSAVSRRAREFGTLKAIGWRSRRIIGQVMGESVAIGLVGGALGIGLGLAGAAVINTVAPKLTAIISTDQGLKFAQHLAQVGPGGGGGPVTLGPGGALGGGTQTIPVPWSASVTLGVIGLAVLLAIVGGLLSGGLGSWRISRLRPADALARVD
jgi:putative ABC transport system permease protein